MLRALGMLTLSSALVLPGLARADYEIQPWFDWHLGGGARIGVEIVEPKMRFKSFLGTV